MEQVGLHHAAPIHRRAVAQARPGRPPAASTSRTTRRGRSARPGRAATRSTARCPATRSANQGAASSSTKVSASSLRQTNELHSGCSPTRIRPTRPHLASAATSAAARPGGQHHQAADAERAAGAVPPWRRRPGTRRRARASAPLSITGTTRSTSTSRAHDLQPPRRIVGAALGRRLPAPPQLHRRHAQVGRARLGLLRRGRQHADQAVLGHAAPRRGHPGVAEERALADPHLVDPQPAARQLVRRDHRVVGQEGAVADGGHRRQRQHRRQLHVPADASCPARAARPGWPCSRTAGTARPAPSPSAGRVVQACQPDAAVHRVLPASARAQSSRTEAAVSRTRTSQETRRWPAAHAVASERGQASPRRPRQPGRRAPGSAAITGKRPRTSADSP